MKVIVEFDVEASTEEQIEEFVSDLDCSISSSLVFARGSWFTEEGASTDEEDEDQ